MTTNYKRDIVEEALRYLNENKYMSCHAIISAMANEIVGLRADLATEKLNNCALKSMLPTHNSEGKPITYVSHPIGRNGEV